jgi:hypothetical protein
MSRIKTIKYIIPDKLAERGARLEQWYKSKGWLKTEFAGKMHIWPQNVNKYFTGELDPTNLAEQLMKEGCDVNWIIDGRGEDLKIRSGIVAEQIAGYGKKSDTSPRLSKETRDRIDKLSKLLQSDPDRSDVEMLDLLIKTMDAKKRKRR